MLPSCPVNPGMVGPSVGPDAEQRAERVEQIEAPVKRISMNWLD